MPNNVENVLRVTGPSARVEKFAKACAGTPPQFAQTAFEKRNKLNQPTRRKPIVLSFHGVAPIPASVLAAGYDPAGYEWCRANWGTKWNAYGAIQCVKVRGGLCYFFETAWQPPEAWLRACAAKFPSLHFELWARDEYPYCMTIDAYDSGDDDIGHVFEVCYGESRKDPAK
jgi:hypothetical protein